MSTRRRKFKAASPFEFLVLRNKLGISKYIKTRKRNKDKKDILLKLALKKIKEKEMKDFIKIGYRRRRVIIPLLSKIKEF